MAEADRYIVDVNPTNYLAAAEITPTGFVDNETIHNIHNQRLASRVTATLLEGIVLVFDLRSAKDVDIIAILNHTFTSDATVTIQADDDPYFGSLGVDQVITWNARQMVYVWSSVQSYRYWRLLVTDTNNTNYPSIGEIILGEAETLAAKHRWGEAEDHKFGNIIQTTPYGTTWRYHQHYGRSFSGIVFNKVSDVDMLELEAMLKATEGSAFPVLFLDGDGTPNNAVFGHWNDKYGRTFSFLEWNNLSALTLKPQAFPNHRRQISL